MKEFSAQQFFLLMLEKLKSAIDRRNKFGAVLTFLFKGNAYGFNIAPLRLV